MTDTTQGADAPNDTTLFNEAVQAETLTQFENPPPQPDTPAPPPPTPEPPKPEPKPDDSASVPAGRLREEAEARRRIERERDDLMRQLNALRAPQQPQQPKVDMFENPQGFVQQELKPFLDQIRADFQTQREAMSLDWALRNHGNEKVNAARAAMEQGMQRGDPNAWGIYNRAMQSHDPYGVIVQAHQQAETLRTIGGDLESYRKRVLEEALNDPEYRKRVIENARGQAQASGAHVARPVAVASSPSLGNVGAAGGDQQVIEPSDEELFRAATTAKRR